MLLCWVCYWCCYVLAVLSGLPVITYEVGGGIAVAVAVAGCIAVENFVPRKLLAMFGPCLVNASLRCVPYNHIVVEVAAGSCSQAAAEDGLAVADGCRESAGMIFSDVRTIAKALEGANVQGEPTGSSCSDAPDMEVVKASHSIHDRTQDDWTCHVLGELQSSDEYSRWRSDRLSSSFGAWYESEAPR